MKLIILKGAKDTGKTTTMNIVYKILLDDGATVVEKPEQLGADPKDFKCLIEYRGKKIAFYIMGDYSNGIKEALNTYKDKCDLLLIPPRTEKITPSVEKELNAYKNVTIDKAVNRETPLLANLSDALKIITEIYQM